MFLQVIFETRVDITSAVCALWLGKNFVIFYILKSAVMLCDAVRLQRLMQEMMAERNNKTMVFVETKRRADELSFRLKRAG